MGTDSAAVSARNLSRLMLHRPMFGMLLKTATRRRGGTTQSSAAEGVGRALRSLESGKGRLAPVTQTETYATLPVVIQETGT